jgi:hypothetical protein
VNWTIKLIRPKIAINKVVFPAWEMALGDLESWMKRDLVKSMVFGGDGIQGIAQTPFYKFIISPDGLSQLGIEKTEPPKLLKAYERSAFSVKRSKRVISLKFGNVARLKSATPHPASGQGQLKVSSWLEWILDGDQVIGRGFVARKDIPKTTQDKIRLGPPIGGLMLSRGAFNKSTGSWRFPQQFANYEDEWLAKNVVKIQQAIIKQMIKFFQVRLLAK